MFNYVERESLENYLETVLMLQKKQERVRAVDVAEALQLSRASVSRALRNMREAGYLTEDVNLTFTSQGLHAAIEVAERHELLTKYFVLVSGVDASIASHCACRVEHVISTETATGIANFLAAGGIETQAKSLSEIASYLPEANERLESGEDYLEAIYVLSSTNASVRAADVARELSLSRASVSRGLGLLREKGYIEVSSQGLLGMTLTGTQLAEKIWEKHRAVAELLAFTAGIDKETAGREACRIEHMIGDEVYDGICAYLKCHASAVE